MLPGRCLRLVLVVATGLASWMSGAGSRSAGAQRAPDQASAYAVARQQLIAFDSRSGVVIRRVAAAEFGHDSPDLAVSPSGDRLFVLGVRLEGNREATTSTLSLVDTTTWRVRATTRVPWRVRYPVAGSSSMVLTRDGSRLFVYNYRFTTPPAKTPFWLSVLDAHSLRPLPGHISLPRCGGASLIAVPQQIVVLCYGEEGATTPDVRFVDVHRLKVVARIPVDGVGLVASPDGKNVYLGGPTITEINTAQHRVVRAKTYPPEAPWTGGVPFLHAIAISDDGRRLIMGILADRADTSSAYALRVFSLPSLRPVRTVPLPQFAHFVAGPGGTLILFPMADAPNRTWQVDMLNSGLDRSRPLFTADGPVLQLVVARSPVAPPR